MATSIPPITITTIPSITTRGTTPSSSSSSSSWPSSSSSSSPPSSSSPSPPLVPFYPHLGVDKVEKVPPPSLPSPLIWCSRRSLHLAALALCLSPSYLPPPPAHARDRRNRRNIAPEEFKSSSNGLKFYDLIEGKGPMVEKGQIVSVHFDCIFRGIDAVSSRESKLLGGNRIIAQPYDFVVGSIPGKERKRESAENANGLFSAQAAPKPPPALYSIVEGMRVGGKRLVVVPPEAGYGEKGLNEIPPGATFELDVELLEVKKNTT